MELAWIGDALLGPSTLLNGIIVLQCFRTLATPARKSQLCSTSLATRSTLPQLQIENPNFVAHKSSTRSALPQLQLENRSASLVREAHFRSSPLYQSGLHVFCPWLFCVPRLVRVKDKSLPTYKWIARSALTCGNPAMQLRLASRNFSLQVQ